MVGVAAEAADAGAVGGAGVAAAAVGAAVAGAAAGAVASGALHAVSSISAKAGATIFVVMYCSVKRRRPSAGCAGLSSKGVGQIDSSTTFCSCQHGFCAKV